MHKSNYLSTTVAYFKRFPKKKLNASLHQRNVVLEKHMLVFLRRFLFSVGECNPEKNINVMHHQE